MTNKIKPTINQDGTETVTLYGTTVDVTKKDTFTLFKREYTLDRPKAKKSKTISKKEAYDILQSDPKKTDVVETPEPLELEES